MSDQNLKKQEGELRQRLRELMAVPDRDRTDEQWDELAALELQLAPGNRIDSPRRGEPGPQSALVPGRRPAKSHNPGQRPGSGKKARKPGR
jgi:hypothetical protein